MQNFGPLKQLLFAKIPNAGVGFLEISVQSPGLAEMSDFKRKISRTASMFVQYRILRYRDLGFWF